MESCKCPITQEIFDDPVIGDDGHTYERKAITDWLKKNGTSPITRQPMDVNTLKTNHVVKQMVEELRTTSQSQQVQFRFQLDVDIKKTRQKPIFQGFGKTIYEVPWINRDGPPIILLKIGGAKASREASFYVQLSCHPHIVRTFGLVQSTPDAIMLLQECAPHGDLSDLLQESGFKPNERVLWRIFEQICDAMICLADNGIVHGDLACRNVLVFQYHSDDPDKNLVKLTDFGLTRGSKLYSVVDSPSMTTMTVIPIRYAAPEILRNPDKLSYSEKSDVYALGVLMWEACSYGQLPYSNLHNDNDVRQQKLEDKRLPQPSSCGDELWAIINQCWHLDPQIRPDFRSLRLSLLRIAFQPASKSEKQAGMTKRSMSASTDRRSVATKLNETAVSSQTTTEFPTNTTTKQSIPSHHNRLLPLRVNVTNALPPLPSTSCLIHRTNFQQHESNNENNQGFRCSFCQELQPSSKHLTDHLVLCGSKTDQCPNCRKYVRRAIFNYHYENNCANLDEPATSIPPPRHLSAHRPSLTASKSALPRVNDPVDVPQENRHDSTNVCYRSNKIDQPPSTTSNSRSLDIQECEFCNQRCVRSDYEVHQKNCRLNPINVTKKQERISLILDNHEFRSSTSGDPRSKEIVSIPCEFCNEQIDFNSWAAHTEICCQRENRPASIRSARINREPIIDKIPCEYCGKQCTLERLQSHQGSCKKNPTNMARASRVVRTPLTRSVGLSTESSSSTVYSTFSSTYSSFSSRTASTHSRVIKTENIRDRVDTSSQTVYYDSHTTTNTNLAKEQSKLHEKYQPTFSTIAHEPLKQPREKDGAGAIPISPVSHARAYNASRSPRNIRLSSDTQRLPCALDVTIPLDRTLFDIQSEVSRASPRQPEPSNTHTVNCQSASRSILYETRVSRVTSSIVNKSSSTRNTTVFYSSDKKDQEHQPVINDRYAVSKYIKKA